MATIEVTKVIQRSRHYFEEEVVSDTPVGYQTSQWQSFPADGYPPVTTYPDSDYQGTDLRSSYYQDQSEIELHRVNNRTQRIRDAMFPESHSSGAQMTVLMNRSTAVQKLAEPAQMLKHAVINIINYMEDADVAVEASPDLVQLLLDDYDPDAQKRAANLTHQLGKKQASRYGLATQEELVRALLRLLEGTRDPETLEESLAALWQISRCPQGARLLRLCLTIPILVRMLGSPSTKVMHFSLNTLHNLLLYIDEAKGEVRQCGGILAFVSLLIAQDVRVLTLLVDSLHILAYNDQETKLAINMHSGVLPLIHIMNTSNYEKLLFTTSRLLQVLSICPTTKPVIVDNGGIQALGRHLDSQSNRLMMSCLWTLRNLSDQAFHVKGIDALIQRLIHYLSDPNEHISTCSAGCLSNLTCQNPDNKTIVVASSGVQALVRTLINFIDREELVEPILCALRHVTHRHPQARAAQVILVESNGLSAISHLLNKPQGGELSWPLAKALVGLIRNLALHPEIRETMRDMGVHQGLCDILLRSYGGMQDLAQQRASVVSMQSEMSYVDGVRMVDMCELSLSALQAMAKDPRSRITILRSRDLLSVNVRLLHHESEYVSRAAASLLSELAVDQEGAQSIEREGATSRLTELLHSRNEAIAMYAATVLYRMAADKSPDYRNRLAIELHESLLDAGVVEVEGVHLGLPDQETVPITQQYNPFITNPGMVPQQSPNTRQSNGYAYSDRDDQPFNYGVTDKDGAYNSPTVRYEPYGSRSGQYAAGDAGWYNPDTDL